jgi:hypothetical protein
MIVRYADDDDIFEIIHALRTRDLVEIDAVRFEGNSTSIAEAMIASRANRVGDLCLATSAGHAVALVGGGLTSPRVASVYMVATDRWGEIALAATRWAMRDGIGRVLKTLVNRAECRCWEGHTVARNWLERLGFRPEGRHPLVGKHGEAFMTYAWLNPDPEFAAPDDAGD